MYNVFVLSDLNIQKLYLFSQNYSQNCGVKKNYVTGIMVCSKYNIEGKNNYINFE